jgi:hypothetical protein
MSAEQEPLEPEIHEVSIFFFHDLDLRI